VNATIREWSGRMLLSAAAWYGRNEVIALLLENPERFSVRWEKNNGYTSIDAAVSVNGQCLSRLI
jgi:ankyrin repeat protein